jgi:hypothetical protein
MPHSILQRAERVYIKQVALSCSTLRPPDKIQGFDSLTVTSPGLCRVFKFLPPRTSIIGSPLSLIRCLTLQATDLCASDTSMVARVLSPNS